MKQAITMQDVFEYLKEHMHVDAEIVDEPQNYESPGYSTVEVRIALLNPETGQIEQIG